MNNAGANERPEISFRGWTSPGSGVQVQAVVANKWLEVVALRYVDFDYASDSESERWLPHPLAVTT